MRLPKNLLSGDYKQPQVFLCQVDKSIIGGLNVTNFSGNFKFNSYDEISFDVDRMYIDNNSGEYCVNPLYDYIEAPRVIYVVDFGYFEIIQSGIVYDGTREYKQCTCYSYEFILSTKYLDLFTINMGTVESIDGVQLYTTADVSKSLIHLVLDKTNGAWTPGHVDINLQNRQRSFEINHETIYDFLLNDVSDTFKCVFEFDTRDNTVNIYDEETYGQSSGVYINKDNLSQSVEVNYNGDEIKTCLYVYGDSDLDIRAVNLGLPYIMNLDYYFSKEWMGEDLYNAYEAYCKKIEEKQPEYTQLLEDWSKCYDEYSEIYNRVPEYYDDEDIPTVNSKDKLPTASEENVFEIYKVKDGDKVNYYICKVQYIDGNTVYSWVLDIDENVASYLVLPEPSVEYAGIVARVPNESTGTTYWICKVSESPSDENNWTTTYAWVPANKEEGIKLLKEKEQCYLDIQSVHVAAGYAETGNANYQRYKDNYDKLVAVQQRISEEEKKAEEKYEELLKIEEDMGIITSSLKLEDNFTQEQIIALNSFIREDEYTDSNFVVTKYDDDNDVMETKRQLKEAAEKELKKISQPQFSFDMNMANLLAIHAFEPILNNFQLGNYVVVEIRPNYVIKTQILEVQMSFDDISDFNVTFGNLTALTSQIDMHSALMSQAVSAGKSVAQSGSYWKKGADTATSINSRIERGLIDAVTSLKTDSKNQAISFDSRGIHLRRYKGEEQNEYEDDQIWMNNDKIVFTDDGWRTAKMAIGKFVDENLGETYGIIAPNIVGTLLAGENLVIDSDKGDGTLSSFRVDKNGARLYNSTFLMEKEVEYQDENNETHTKLGQIMIDPKYGIVAGNNIYTTTKTEDGTAIVPAFDENNQGVVNKEDGFPINSNFFLDINGGNAYFRGTVYADGGYFTGSLSGADITGAVGTFDGTIKAGDGDIGGWIIDKGCLYSDLGENPETKKKRFVALSSKYDSEDASTNYAIWAGAIKPSEAPFSVDREGNLVAKNGTFYGKLEGATGTFSGELSAAKGSFAGDISAATGTFKGALQIGEKEDGSGYNFVVNSDGSVSMTGNITLGGAITWSTPPVQYQYSSNNKIWHDTYKKGDIYRRESLSGGEWGEGYQFIGTGGLTDKEIVDLISDKYGISVTKLNETSIESPIITGGEIRGGIFKNISQDTWFGLGEDNGKWGFILSNNANTEGIFGVYNGDFGYTSFSGKLNYTFLTVNALPDNEGVAYPQGTWDFSQATVKGLSVTGSTATFA